MTSGNWTLAGIAARLLANDEREAVLGDLEEASESAGRGFMDVSGLVLRRQWELWRSWRPWVAGLGLALPGSLALMGISVSLSWSCLRLLGPRTLAGAAPAHYGFLPILCQVLLLAACSWSGGVVMGSISRRTLWVSALLCCSPCLFCLARFRIESLSRFSLLLFVLPAMLGVRHGWRTLRIGLRPAIALAAVVTLCMSLRWRSGSLWVLDWALIWPAWYLVATALRPALQS
jgi:hypothetical protein